MITNNIPYETDYIEIFNNNFNELKYVVFAFFITMAVVYTLEYHNTKYAKTLLQSNNVKELYTETFINACMSIIVVCYMAFSRGRHWRTVVLSIFGFFALTFMIDTIVEASGLNRHLKKSDTNKEIGYYAKLDEHCQEGEIEDITITTQNSKEYPFIKSFVRSVMIFGCIYLVIKIYNILKCVYYGYKDEKGCTHIQNEIFFNGAISPQVGFGLELLVIISSTFISAKIKEIFCNKFLNNTNLMILIFTCVLCVINHVIFQYTGMYGVSDKCEKK